MWVTVARYSRLCLSRESDLCGGKIARESDEGSQRGPTTAETRLPSVRVVTERTKEATLKYLFAVVSVMAVASLGAVAGCGGEERPSRDAFSDRLQSIDEQGGERWGRLAQQAQDLKPDEPFPADVKQALADLVEFQEQAVAELEGLTPPEAAEESVEMLIEALRERTEIFEQVIEAGRFTQQDFDRVSQSGEDIDQAFEQLRERGFLPAADEHQEE
jgi:hypothetical protein